MILRQQCRAPRFRLRRVIPIAVPDLPHYFSAPNGIGVEIGRPADSQSELALSDLAGNSISTVSHTRPGGESRRDPAPATALKVRFRTDE
jgi:hypothetical protein